MKIFYINKFVLLILMLFFSLNVNASNISTKKEADNFIANYCIEIVNGIHDAKNRAEIKIKNGDNKGFVQEGTFISVLADLYSKLCK